MTTPADDPRDDALEPPEPRASDVLGQALSGAARRAGLDPTDDRPTGHVVWRAMGGWRGVLESVLPGLVFVVAYTLTIDRATGEANLPLSLGLSVGLALVFTVVRLVQRTPPSAAIGGLIATAVAAGLALLTGRGEDNFIPGFITNAAYGTALLVSALIGWSLIGLAAGYLMGEGAAWRRDPRKRRVFFWLAIAWAMLFYARLAVQFPLYLAGDVATLGTLKLVMGLPLFAPLVAVTWLAARALYRRPPE
ncbi:DUF3159 domain-containing protein [Microbacterium sp. zg.Y1090]|uniref:DUF3159 domain-containing protein n=1 Tax=Microbacterium TaxID=33882 RepID=UPI00214AF6FA|nr:MULTISPECIES: DUF3159 domain-containing protein [unclassified Microbacterium]MCR2811848.1 DUF3159 domain-containing protein [Microbacterium sp. zg.Y1084]MCR2818713.1 DUF3159 domain-containing protein [Microbacterium sp. zg.Y1090]MDL5486526.1 DUF3159 domain-containing protein [Microbacterium sp. zg-Y1211]WIM27034.1 DUF3159 domain-containing protein [Microbacterium sp. zg-Y1090]